MGNGQRYESGPFPPFQRVGCSTFTSTPHWLYVMKKKFLMELIFTLELYLWQRIKERLSTEEGRSLKTEVVRGSPPWPSKNSQSLSQESGMWIIIEVTAISFSESCFYMKAPAGFTSGVKFEKFNIRIKSHDFTYYLLLMVCSQM